MSAHADILRVSAHRPWPLPQASWLMFQSWQQQLFAHWRVPLSMLRPLVPRALDIDVFDGSAWVGITPFLLTGLQLRALPPFPFGSEFPELNLRTYVTVQDRPGVFFFSLDAGSLLAVHAARVTYGLPYQHAAMSITHEDGWIRYRSRRMQGGAELRIRYRATDASPAHAAPGSLDHFLVERYALYVIRGGWIMRGDIHHAPWSLHTAEAEIELNTIAAASGLQLPAEPPLLHYSTRQDALIWPLVRARGVDA